MSENPGGGKEDPERAPGITPKRSPEAERDNLPHSKTEGQKTDSLRNQFQLVPGEVNGDL